MAEIISNPHLLAQTLNCNNIKIVTGTVATSGGTLTVSYPSGFTMYNSCVIGCFVDLYGTRYTEQSVVSAELVSSGVKLILSGGGAGDSGAVNAVLYKYVS